MLDSLSLIYSLFIISEPGSRVTAVYSIIMQLTAYMYTAPQPNFIVEHPAEAFSYIATKSFYQDIRQLYAIPRDEHADASSLPALSSQLQALRILHNTYALILSLPTELFVHIFAYATVPLVPAECLLHNRDECSNSCEIRSPLRHIPSLGGCRLSPSGCLHVRSAPTSLQNV